MMEFYEAYANYRTLMNFTEGLLRHAAREALGTEVFSYQGRELDLSRPFARLTMVEAIREHHPGYTVEQLGDAAWLREARRAEGRTRPDTGLGTLQLLMFEETTEAELWNPTFIVDYPVEVSPLARASDSNPEITERFELFIVGREIANGFSELNDPKTRPRASRHRPTPRKPATRRPCTTTPTTCARSNTASADRRLRHRHRPPGHAADRQPGDSRRDPVPADASLNEWQAGTGAAAGLSTSTGAGLSIHQLQIAFDAVQDRLVLRVATTANEEIRAHLTRRFVREIWPHLMRVLNGHLGGAMPSSGVLQPTRPARTTAPSASPSGTTSSPARWAARRCWWPNARSRRQARAVAASYCASPANAAWCWTSTRTSPRSSVRCCAQRSRWPTGTSRSTMMPPRPRPASPTTCSRRSSTAPRAAAPDDVHPNTTRNARHRRRRHTVVGTVRRRLSLARRRAGPGTACLSRRQRPAGTLAGPCPFRHRRDRFRPRPELPRHLGGVARRRHAKRPAALHLVRKAPFRAHDLRELHARWPHFAEQSGDLLARWPALTPGMHRLHLDDERVCLTLFFGDASDGLTQLDAQADALFLDGFSPARNPELWTPRICHLLARLCKTETTLATWSVLARCAKPSATRASRSRGLRDSPASGRCCAATTRTRQAAGKSLAKNTRW